MNNKVGMFFSYWSRDWKLDFTEAARKVAGCGFDLMEINLSGFTDLPKAKKQELKDTADGLGLTISCCIGLAPDQDLSSPDASVRERGLEYCKKLLDDCKFLNAPVFSGLNFCAWPASPPKGMTDKRPYVERSIEGVKKLMPVAEQYGVKYALEVVNRFEQFLINDAEEAVAFCDAVGSKACTIHLDTFHMNIEEDTFRDAIKKVNGRLGHFHLGEPNRKPPGTGRIPWDEVFGALKEIDYQGTIVMEPFVRPGGTVAQDVALWRDLSKGASDAQLDEAAKKALAFVRGKLA